MYAEERQQTILEVVRRTGRVGVAGLASRFDITTETVRRDLTLLEQRGLLRRVHGGAIPVNTGPEVRKRTPPAEPAALSEQRRIAQAALAHLPEDGAVFLDGGRTVDEFVGLIPADRQLTVVTNAIDSALRLTDKGSVTVMLVGGRIKSRPFAVVDDWAMRLLSEIRVDVAFLAPGGVSLARGLTTSDPSEAMVKRAAISAAGRTVVLADHHTVGRDHFARFGGLADIDTLITDDRVDSCLARRIGRAGPRVLTV
ncbi:DeoR/GlpR family DNA-binding transcription regulator [Streptomyces sp. NPDC088400]|uniref:DeoR/GlpR family DNA-binding transcription regulator n=1 Tax=Streptomyces sp. NPDC088400 TaxID=3365861 RepID=UPI0038189505